MNGRIDIWRRGWKDGWTDERDGWIDEKDGWSDETDGWIVEWILKILRMTRE